MSKIKNLIKTQLVRSTASMLFTTGVTSIIGFIFWKLIAGHASQGSVGQATTIIAIISTASLIASSGISPAILLTLSSKGHELDYKRLVHGYVLIASLVSAVISLIAEIIFFIFSKEYYFLSNPLIFSAVIILSALTAGGVALDSSSVALHRSRLMPIRNITQSIVKIILILPFVELWFNAPTAVLISTLIGGLFANMYVTLQITGSLFPKKSDITNSWNSIKKGIWHHQATSLGSTIPPVVTPLLVTAFIGASNSALFSISWMIGALFFMISPSVSGAILASTANQQGINIGNRIKQSSFIIGGLLLVPMLLVFIFPDLILGFFGASYEAAKTLLILLALSSIPDAITNIAVAFLRLKNNFKAATILNTSMGMGTLVLLCSLMPLLGVTSAGVAWLIAQSTGSIVILIYIYIRYMKKRKESS
jgi:O-antigen/teichoic acid export membrane protein